MTSKEALEFFVKNIDCDVYEFDLNEVIKHKRCLEQDLERLEKLENENQDLKELYDLQSQLNRNQYKIIKEFYEKNLKLEDENEKLKKTIEILEKQNEGQTISQEEYDLLKEYLEND